MPPPPVVFCLLTVFKVGLDATSVAEFLLHEIALEPVGFEFRHQK